jgi:hypothetical protein
VKNVEMQGSVWGSLKWTTLLNTLIKIILQQPHLNDKYKNPAYGRQSISRPMRIVAQMP